MNLCVFLFFFNDTATTEIYTLSLHDALPIFDLHRNPKDIAVREVRRANQVVLPMLHLESLVSEAGAEIVAPVHVSNDGPDRKSTRLNSSHANISYAVFCLKKNILNHCQCLIC